MVAVAPKTESQRPRAPKEDGSYDYLKGNIYRKGNLFRVYAIKGDYCDIKAKLNNETMADAWSRVCLACEEAAANGRGASRRH